MQGKTHAAVGCATVLAVHLTVTGIPSMRHMVIAVATGTVAAVLPDIDLESSKASKQAASVLFLISILALGAAVFVCIPQTGGLSGLFETSGVYNRQVLGAVMFIVYIRAGLQGPHRGFTHSVTALIAVSVSAYLAAGAFAADVFAGYASHLVLDLLNKKGMRLLWPSEKTYCIGICTASGHADQVVHIIGIFVSAVEILITFWALIEGVPIMT